MRLRLARRRAPVVPSGFVANHPRLLLTDAKLTELVARKDAPTAEYTAFKSYVDTYAVTPLEAALSGALGTGGVGTTFDAAAVPGGWPTASHKIRIDLEMLTVTRSGTTFTVVSRGDNPGLGATTAAVHAAGAEVWYHPAAGDFPSLAAACGLLVQLGVAGYAVKARYYLNELAVYFAPTEAHTGDNAIRWYGFNLACAYDWTHGELSANEKAVYPPLIVATCEDHTAFPKEGNPPPTVRQSWQEQFMMNNIANGQIRSVLALAAAMADERPTEAAAYWDMEVTKLADWMLPALNGGAGHDGVPAEGSEYCQTDWVQLNDIFHVVESATADAGAVPGVAAWMARLARSVFYLTLPGTSNSQTTTTVTVASGSTAATAADASTFSVGEQVSVGGGVFPTAVVAKSGNSLTLRDPAPQAFTDATLSRQQMLHAFGDVETYHNYDDFPITAGEPQLAMAIVQPRVDATTAGHVEHWLQNVATLGAFASSSSWRWLIARDPTVTPVDYTATLPLNYATTDADGFGLLIGRTSWTDPAASQVIFIAGHEMIDHATSYWGSFGYRRKGAWLTRHLVGYGGTGITNTTTDLYWDYPQAGQYGETPYIGAAFHNAPWMNGHGGLSAYHAIDQTGRTPCPLVRSAAPDAYLYGRGDLSPAYVNNWAVLGFANNDARTFVRDFLWVAPDLVAVHDRMGYANATASPTRWHRQTPGQPTVTGQRSVMTYAGQTLVEDVVLPAAAAFNVVDLDALDPYLAGYRTEVTSGATTAAEWGFFVLQGGDSGFSPASVTSLTTTNANVAQVGSAYVLGFVKDATPTLPISYSYTGTPAHYLCGFVPDTAYHVVDDGSGVTITAATGSGDTTATAAGLIIIGGA